MYLFFLILEVQLSLCAAEKRCWIFLLHQTGTTQQLGKHVLNHSLLHPLFSEMCGK